MPVGFEERSVEALANLVGEVHCELPTHKLYQFYGSMRIFGEEPIGLDESNLLLMGSMLKNTEWVVGLCVYAGPETKMGLNLKM